MYLCPFLHAHACGNYNSKLAPAKRKPYARQEPPKAGHSTLQQNARVVSKLGTDRPQRAFSNRALTHVERQPLVTIPPDSGKVDGIVIISIVDCQ